MSEGTKYPEDGCQCDDFCDVHHSTAGCRCNIADHFAEIRILRAERDEANTQIARLTEGRDTWRQRAEEAEECIV